MQAAARNMPVRDTCCCWKSQKGGSYACGFYTLVLYTAMFIAGICHAQTVTKSASLLGFCILMIVLSGTCIICSLILIIGLYKENRFLLLPWTVSVSKTTLIDVMVSFYLIRDAITEPFLAVVFVTDVLICAVNVYALLCVLSQYQEYKLGAIRENAIQQRDPEAAIQQPQRPVATTSVTDDISTNAHLPPVNEEKNARFIELTTISEEVHSTIPNKDAPCSTLEDTEI